jgi:hypothetical protein
VALLCLGDVFRGAVFHATPRQAIASQPKETGRMSANSKRVFYVKYLANPIFAELL